MRASDNSTIAVKIISKPTDAIGIVSARFGKIESVPGVKSAGIHAGGSSVFFQPEGRPPAGPGQEPTANYKIVTPDYLKTMGTRLVSGREISAADIEGAAPVAVISETVARRYWPDSSPIGAHITGLARIYSGQRAPGSAKPLEIVGVVKDQRSSDLLRPEPAIYSPFAQKPAPAVWLVVRTSVPPMSIAPAMRDAVL